MKKFNIHFFILFFIAVTVFIADYIIYIFNTNFMSTNILTGLMLFSLFFILRKKQKIAFETNFHKSDYIFIVLLIIYMLFSIVFPDLLWDTRSYHIYLQENVFVDKLNSDFFAARNLNSFLFALGDRIHFLFRSFLGYRLGTIISYYLMLILYYQLKRVLAKLNKNSSKKSISLFSIIPVMMSIIFAYTGSYYIDNFGLIFLLEIFYIVFFEENVINEKIKLYVLGLLIGLAIAIKVTNVIFLIPLAVYFLIRNFKDIKKLKIYNYILEIIFVLLPFAIYAIYNYITTKNPVFPYYNNIFKSEYFMYNSWKDKNFGARNIFEFLFWPVYIIFNPKRAFDTRFVDFSWGIGYITVIIYIVYSIIKKKIRNNKLFILSLIIFINYYLWQILLIGYVRYATILLVLSMIVIISILEELYFKKLLYFRILTFTFILTCIPSVIYDFGIVVKEYKSISEFVSEYKLNFKMIFKDRKTDKLDVDGILGAIGDDSLLPTLLSNGNKIYNLEEWVTITNDKTREMYNEKILNNTIYIPIDANTIDRKKDYLVRNNFEIIEEIELKGNYNFLSTSDNLYLLKVRKIEDN